MALICSSDLTDRLKSRVWF